MSRRRSIVLTLGFVGPLSLGGCLPSNQAPVKADLRATDTGRRVPALVKAADDDDLDVTRELLRALMDDDAAVRLFAIQSLNTRYGQTLGYRYYDDEDRRSQAVQHWQGWLAEHIDASFAEPDRGPAADAAAAAPNPSPRDTDNDGQPDP